MAVDDDVVGLGVVLLLLLLLLLPAEVEEELLLLLIPGRMDALLADALLPM